MVYIIVLILRRLAFFSHQLYIVSSETACLPMHGRIKNKVYSQLHEFAREKLTPPYFFSVSPKSARQPFTVC